MRLLLVTEKFKPRPDQCDGGARLVQALRGAFGPILDVAQFDDGQENDQPAPVFRFTYPNANTNRFTRRIANAAFIASQVRTLLPSYTHVIFAHISMQFGFADAPLKDVIVWTFPMFLTPSYAASGEIVPPEYTRLERDSLAGTGRILTPSYFEKLQLTRYYGLPDEQIRVVPRGVSKFPPTLSKRPSLDTPRFCSVGSIKRQKNTLGLIRLFHKIRIRYPKAKLLVIGPVQDASYAADVLGEVEALGLGSAVKFTGPVVHAQLASVVAESHIHLSTSRCETFGRAIFETLALGLPNIVAAEANAAFDFLHSVPYVRFFNDVDTALTDVDATLLDWTRLSELSREVADLYHDDHVTQRMAAEIVGADALVVSDFDGTLFHKNDADLTRRSIKAFQSYAHRIICSARSFKQLDSLAVALGIDADYLISWSGAMLTNRTGQVLWSMPFSTAEIAEIQACFPVAEKVFEGREVMQFVLRDQVVSAPLGFRVEIYEGASYIRPWRVSKLHSVLRLLRHLNWSGRVSTFGDNQYDLELLNYFSGIRICREPSTTSILRESREVTHAQA